MATSESEERDPVAPPSTAERDAAAYAATLFDTALDLPLTESRLRAIERTHVLTSAQMSRAAEIVGGPLPAAVWSTGLRRVLLLAAAGHVVAGLGLVLVEVWEDLGQIGSVALAAAVAVAPALAARRVGVGRTAGRVLLTASALLCVPLVVVLHLAFPLPFSSWIVPALVVVLAVPFAMAARSGITWLVPLCALQVSAVVFLEEAGFRCAPVRPPTVPEGQARVRISLCYDHDQKVVDRLVACFEDMGPVGQFDSMTVRPWETKKL